MRSVLDYKPVLSFILDVSITPITTSAWVALATALQMSKSGSLIEIFNSTGCTLAISDGVAGLESLSVKPYTILLGGSSAIFPFELSNGKPLSVKSLDSASSATGILVINIFA